MAEKSPTRGYGFGQWPVVAVGITVHAEVGDAAHGLRCGEGRNCHHKAGNSWRRFGPPVRKPATVGTGRAEETRAAILIRDAIHSLLVTFGGFHREAHLFGEISADEATDGVVLPVGGLDDLGQRRTRGSAQEVQDDGLFRRRERYPGLLYFGGLLGGDLLLGVLSAGRSQDAYR
jgi:hypothetical protein